MNQGSSEMLTRPAQPTPLHEGYVLITGGAGFIGTNLAARLLALDEKVVIYDNLSRAGVDTNLRWLLEQFPATLRIQLGDVRDTPRLREVLKDATCVYHFAAQVAVTTSFEAPLSDFDINAGGTVNVLEGIRVVGRPIPLLFTSTNKVYGSLAHLKLTSDRSRYIALDAQCRPVAINEGQPLDPESPYGCSKAAADQYVYDYARSLSIPTTIFRMSCIYGPHQFGTEDQGWIAHFLRCAIKNHTATVYGDGRQVRDVLFVDDLVEAMIAARKYTNAAGGLIFNIGGGLENTLSVLELFDIIKELHGTAPRVSYANWRQGDQLYYVSDTSAFERVCGWRPHVTIREGISRLYEWLVNTEIGRKRNAASLHATTPGVK